MEDKKFKFIKSVIHTLHDHPEWLTDVLGALTSGMLQRIEIEMTKRANAEFALVMAYDAGKSKLKPRNRESVERAIIEADAFHGTKFVEDLAKKLKITPKE